MLWQMSSLTTLALGGVFTLELKTIKGRLVIINNYWPTKPQTDTDSSNALWNKYKRWLFRNLA